MLALSRYWLLTALLLILQFSTSISARLGIYAMAGDGLPWMDGLYI